MVIKVGINGFGRIGRVIFRKFLQTSDIEVIAINDPAIDTEYICYLIKFDSTHGKFMGNISFTENEVNVDGFKIKILHEKAPQNIPWVSVGAEYVIEASGMFTNMEKASGHLSSGVKRVIVTAPSLDVPMLIVGVNEHMIAIEDKVLSCASSTLYCLAPIVKILEDKFGVIEGFVTSIHAMTPSLKPLDSLCLRGRHWRDHRSIHQNIIPATTGACKTLHKIIPQIKDKLSGLAFRVPIVNVSILDVSIRLEKSTSVEDIVKCIHQHCDTTLSNVITVSNEEAVSSDFLGETHSCILDVNSSCQLSPKFFKLVCWYENEYSYACRVLDTILFSERQFKNIFIPNIESMSRGTTTDRCKSIFIPNNYSFEISPDMISSASQDTGIKMKLFPKTLKNNTLGYRYIPTTQTTLRRVVNKTNEALKSKVDDVIQLQNNVGPLFQSCLQFGPACDVQNRELRNHEQLEKVKREFSKVVNMTEDLLKKSSHNQMSNKHIRELEQVKIDLDEMKDSSKETNEPIVEIINDTPVNTKIDDEETSKNNGPSTILDSVKSELNSLPSISEVGISENNIADVNHINIDYTLKLFHDDTICNMVQVFKNDEIENNKDMTTQIAGTRETQQFELDLALDNFDVNENRNNETKIETVIPTKKNETCENNGNVQCEENINDRNIEDKTDRVTNIQSNQRMVERILTRISVNRKDIISAGTSRCASPCLPGTVRRKLDIYDKLDSASGSDSETSFEEKKSQIINITDLTNSTEDLARLDKICRIIEISDELSDKLFSALHNSGSLDKNKTWSFKDLCERIQLDDFCNKVFRP